MASGTLGGTSHAPPGAPTSVVTIYAWEQRDAAQDESDELKNEVGDARAM